MSTPDETHHEPANIHDEAAAKSGDTPTAGDARTADHGHGGHGGHDHSDHGDHAHGDSSHGDQAAAGTFIEEGSLQDQFLAWVLAPLSALGLVLMMWMIWSAP